MIKFKTLIIFILPVFAIICITNALYTLAFYTIYFFTCCSKPRIICKPTLRNIKIIQDCRTVEGMFFPYIFAINGIIQTIMMRRINVKRKRKTECIVVQTDDGGIFMVDVYEPENRGRRERKRYYDSKYDGNFEGFSMDNGGFRSGCDIGCEDMVRTGNNSRGIIHDCNSLCKKHFNMKVINENVENVSKENSEKKDNANGHDLDTIENEDRKSKKSIDKEKKRKHKKEKDLEIEDTKKSPKSETCSKKEKINKQKSKKSKTEVDTTKGRKIKLKKNKKLTTIIEEKDSLINKEPKYDDFSDIEDELYDYSINNHVVIDSEEISNVQELEGASCETSYSFVQQINNFIKKDEGLREPKIYYKHRDGFCRINQIDWTVRPDDINNIILVHGFNSSSDSNYIVKNTYHLISEGYRVFAFNSRGTKTPLLTPIFFNIGWTCDLKDCLDYVLINYPGYVSMVGFSLGGNWTAKLLTELDPIYFTRVRCGIGISIPFDFYKLNAYMHKWPYISINRILVKNMKKYFLGHDVLAPYFDIIRKCTTIKELDTNVTCKIFGIKNLESFYKDGSCGKYIEKISIPFMVINSSDDPVVPVASIPLDKIKESENLILLLTKRGGHLGFLGYNWDKTYPDQIILEFVRTCLKL